MKLDTRKILCCVFALVLSGCASNVVFSPSQIDSSSGSEQPKTLAQTVEITLDTGYSRTLRSGSQWIKVGSVAQGDVYKAYRNVFTLEGAQVHEADLVVSGNDLVGFYLPVEHGFSSLEKTVKIYFN